MSSQRFFIIDGSRSEGDIVQMGEGESRHMFDVVRARAGDEVILLDGEGGTYRAVIRTGGDIGGLKKPSRVTAEILSVTRADRPAPVDIAIPVIRPNRLDYAVEKCVEIGVRRIIPFSCGRSVWKGRAEETLSLIHI